LPSRFVVLLLALYCALLVWCIPWIPVEVLEIGCCVLGPLVFCVALRRWTQGIGCAVERLKSFRMQESLCFCKSDRCVLEINIEALVRRFELVRDNASTHEAFDAFNGLVQSDVHRLMCAGIVDLGLSYRFIVTVFSLTILPISFDIVAGRYLLGAPWAELWMFLLSCITTVFAILPLLVKLAVVLLKRNLNVPVVCSWLWIVGVTIVVQALAISSVVVRRFLLQRAHESPWYTVAFVVYSVLVCNIALLVFKRCGVAEEMLRAEGHSRKQRSAAGDSV